MARKDAPLHADGSANTLFPHPGAPGKFDRSVSLLAWGYNEELLLESFLKRAVDLLDRTVVDWEIIFVDDGSTDRTGEIAKEYFFWQTVDWSYDVSNLRVFLELLKHYDVVQGIRPTPMRLLSYVPVIRSIYRVKARSDNFRKAVVSLSNYYLLRILFGAHFQDFQNVTFYPTKLLQSVELQGNSSFVNPECLLRAYETGARFIEVPIRFLPRSTGEAKGTKLKSLLKSMRDIGIAWLKWGHGFRQRARTRAAGRQIYRVSEPFHLDDDVLKLVLPLLKEFR
jgi:Glycosyl transferase family 2